MPSDLDPELNALKSLEALPVASKFNIRFVGEGRFSDELYGYHQDGEITIGDQVYGFSNVSTPESLQDSDYKSQWREAARRILSGSDRTAFVTNDGGGGWATVFSGRWLMWRVGEKVFVAADNSSVETTGNAGAYEGIESLQSRCSRGTKGISALSLRAIRDFLEPGNVSPFIPEPPQEPPSPASVIREAHTETRWLGCDEDGPGHAIQQLRDDPNNHRKLFLAGCGWARRFWERLGKRSKTAIEIYERFADGDAPVGDQDAAWSRFKEMFERDGDYFAWRGDVKESESDFFTALIQARAAWHSALPFMKDDPAAEAAIVLPARGVYSLGRGAYIDASDEFSMAGDDRAAEYRAQCDIVRDIFGNPSQPVRIEPSWLASNEGAVAKLAQATYDERAFDQMPELADALEKSGCHNEYILAHCRSQGAHVRGCWVLDLLLAKDQIEFPTGRRMPLLLQADIDEAPTRF